MDASGVVEALALAASQDPTNVKEGETRLKAAETLPGFYSCLADVIRERNCSHDCRLLAVITFKNGIDKYWRRNTNYEISTDERSYIRSVLLTLFEEPDSKIALHTAVLVGRIARLDCPANWPELLPTVTRNVQSPSGIVQHRALLYLYHVTKTLSLKKLPGDRATFRQLSSEAYPFVVAIWKEHTQRFMPGNAGDCSAAVEAAEKSLLCMKVIRKLVIFGFSKIRENEQIIGFLTQLFDAMKVMLRYQGPCLPTVQRMVVNMMKLLHDLLYNDPLSFSPLVEPSLAFLLATLYPDPSNQEPPFILAEKFLIQAFNLFKLILLCEEFQPKESLSHLEHPLTMDARSKISSALTDAALAHVISTTIQSYLRLGETDIESWTDCPEEFHNSLQVGHSWQLSLRSCVSSFFVTVVKERVQVSAEVVMNVYRSVIGQSLSLDSQENILALDAVYAALGLAIHDVIHQVPLNMMFSNEIVPIFSVNKPSMQILRRRMLIFIGQWIGASYPADIIQDVLQLILNSLEKESDIVVKLAAVKTLHIFLDDYNFAVEQFKPWIERSVKLLHCSLLEQLEEDDSKAAVVSTLSLMMDRVQYEITPFAESTLVRLHKLWTDSAVDSQVYLRCTVVQCLTSVITGLGAESHKALPLVHPIISHCINLSDNQTQSMNLVSDGLDLLLAVVCNTETEQATDELLSLFALVLPVLEFGGDSLRASLMACSAFALLFRSKFIERYGRQLGEQLVALYKDTSREALHRLVQVVKLIVQAIPLESPPALSQLLVHMFQTLLDQDGSSLMIADMLALFSGIVLNTRDVANQLIGAFANDAGVTATSIASRLIGIYSDCIDDIVDIRTKKLAALASIALLNNAEECLIVERFAHVVYLVLDCLHDLVDTASGCDDFLLLLSPSSRPHTWTNGSEEVERETADDRRARQLEECCLTSTVSLKMALQQQLLAIKATVGDATFDQLLAQIDHNCKLQLQAFFNNQLTPATN